MKTTLQTILVTCILSALPGCGSTRTTPTAEPVVGMGSGSFSLTDAEKSELMLGDAYVSIFTWHDKPILVVLSDALSSAWGSNTRSGMASFHLNLFFRGRDKRPNREIAFFGEIQSGEKGQITIKGESYDLAKGCLFLVSSVGDDFHVKQMDKDVSELKLEKPDLVAFGKANPEIKAFFSGAAKPK